MALVRRYNVAVVGATGAVGREILRVLANRRFPIKGLRLMASPRSAGRYLSSPLGRFKVERLDKRSFKGIDIAFFSAGAARSLRFAPQAVRSGAFVIDNSSAFRLKDDVPLVIPEVNPQSLKRHRGLVANPNCSTIIMLVAVSPIHRISQVFRIVVATYQAVSGAGARAVAQLYSETKEVLQGLKLPKTSFCLSPRLKAYFASRKWRTLPGQIAFNLIPQVDVFMSGRYTKEEMKLALETRKILSAPRLNVSATCVRVPVFTGHSEAVWLWSRRPLSVARARTVLARAAGVRLADSTSFPRYPLPLDVAGKDYVIVGRLRRGVEGNCLAMWICGDNLRKGAATNAVQIAELFKRGSACLY